MSGGRAAPPEIFHDPSEEPLQLSDLACAQTRLQNLHGSFVSFEEALLHGSRLASESNAECASILWTLRAFNPSHGLHPRHQSRERALWHPQTRGEILHDAVLFVEKREEDAAHADRHLVPQPCLNAEAAEQSLKTKRQTRDKKRQISKRTCCRATHWFDIELLNSANRLRLRRLYEHSADKGEAGSYDGDESRQRIKQTSQLFAERLRPAFAVTNGPITSASMSVRTKQFTAWAGVSTMGSFSLKLVFKTTGVPVRSPNALIRS